jgi:hypothetical protein
MHFGPVGLEVWGRQVPSFGGGTRRSAKVLILVPAPDTGSYFV